ncbi:MAG: FAD-binding protein [Deltaproteobacteria bacterium]|nr:FAD-binding protein [Deltaproteobacteria bacterium]
MHAKSQKAVLEKSSFEDAPEPIPAQDIKETVTAEVMVLGTGVAGLSAALSVAEAGAKTILLEKSPGFNYQGSWNAAIASRLQKQEGIEIDKDALIKTVMEWGSYRTDQQVVKLWADHCDEVMDWLIAMAEKEENVNVVLDPIDRERDWYFPTYPLTHYFMSGVKGDTSL